MAFLTVLHEKCIVVFEEFNAHQCFSESGCHGKHGIVVFETVMVECEFFKDDLITGEGCE